MIDLKYVAFYPIFEIFLSSQQLLKFTTYTFTIPSIAVMSSIFSHQLEFTGHIGSTTYVGRKRPQIHMPSYVRGIKKRDRLRARSRALSEATAPSSKSVHHRNDGIDSEDEEVEGEVLNEVIMAIDMRGKDTIGSAYFVTAQETLYVLADVRYGSIDIIEKRMFLRD